MGIDGSVTSPPYESTLNRKGGIDPEKSEYIGGPHSQINNSDTRYSEDLANIGNDSGDTFWSAARKIVEQVYFSLKPGGHAAWIVKSYVKAGQIVDFHDQWRQLCESVGFVTVHEHRAYVVEEHNPRYNLDGELVVDVKERKSFFRRLLEKKGSPRIDWETVWCMVKPEA
jgi:hypothetical protein